MLSKSKLHKGFSSGHVVSIVVTAGLIILAGLLYLNRQYVVDQMNFWSYQPNSQIASFVDRSGMNDTGKFYFYASQPNIEEAQNFNKLCNRQENNTAILGCYDGRNIYIYDVTNKQLDGILEVTAAHEMLHAIYQRMSDSDKQAVDKLLEVEYNRIKDNKDFAARMAFYDRIEPGQRDNELHSVIGTEFSGISPELENYYRKYFTDRSKIVALHTTYESVFDNLQKQADSLSSIMTRLGNTVERETADYNVQVMQLNNDIKLFNAKANNGSFKNEEEFQSARAMLVVRANQLDSTRQRINADIAQYNIDRQQLQTIASQSAALNQSINSSLAPVPSL